VGAIHYTLAIRSCESAKALKEAQYLFQQASSLGLKPQLSACNSMLKQLVIAQQWQEVMSFFQSMPEQGVRPDQKSYAFLLCAFQELGNSSGAQRALQEMKIARMYECHHFFSLDFEYPFFALLRYHPIADARMLPVSIRLLPLLARVELGLQYLQFSTKWKTGECEMYLLINSM